MNKPTIWRICDEKGNLISKVNADVCLAAVNACVRINPDNPLAVAEALPELVEALKKAEDYLQGIRSGRSFEESDLVDVIKTAIAKLESK